MRAGIALGSNLGDRLGHLQAGRRHLLALHNGSGPFLCSKIYESAPVDCPDGSPLFLNASIELSTDLPPLDLLARLQAIEKLSGRSQDHGFHEPRNLDLDLLYLGSLQLSHSTLTMPHRRIPERLFVLKPLKDICPDRILPNQALTIRDLCDILERNDSPSCKLNFVSYF